MKKGGNLVGWSCGEEMIREIDVTESSKGGKYVFSRRRYRDDIVAATNNPTREFLFLFWHG